MGHGLTLPAAVGDRRQFDGILQRLCERTGRRLRRHRFLGRVVSLWVGYDKDFADGGGFGGRRTLDHVTDSGQDIFQAAVTLVPGPGLPAPVRHVQVSVSDLRRDALQLSLLEDRVRQRDLQQALDAINDRFGDFTIMPATTMLDTFPRRDGPPGHGFCKRFEV
ncbi:MAG: DNA polymerase IV [bacterium ADurb.Bin429]|nr:MAG: DNA polymerase IV [bacterium ADurb.Bin429]